MARLARMIVPGLPHHVTQRGNRRGPIFFEDGDQAGRRNRRPGWPFARPRPPAGARQCGFHPGPRTHPGPQARQAPPRTRAATDAPACRTAALGLGIVSPRLPRRFHTASTLSGRPRCAASGLRSQAVAAPRHSGWAAPLGPLSAGWRRDAGRLSGRTQTRPSPTLRQSHPKGPR